MAASPQKRLGILGGTFDPPHIGHLLLGEAAYQTLELEQVLFLPAGQPPHKQQRVVSTAADRLEMTRLAVANNDHFMVDTTDIERPFPHYTATLLPLLHQAYPTHELWLLIGGDSLHDLPTWHDPQAVVAGSRLAVLPRPGAVIDWERVVQAIPCIRRAITFLEGPSIAVSSTQIRQWAAAGRSLRYLVPEKVLRYIEQQRLYQYYET